MGGAVLVFGGETKDLWRGRSDRPFQGAISDPPEPAALAQAAPRGDGRCPTATGLGTEGPAVAAAVATPQRVRTPFPPPDAIRGDAAASSSLTAGSGTSAVFPPLPPPMGSLRVVRLARAMFFSRRAGTSSHPFASASFLFGARLLKIETYWHTRLPPLCNRATRSPGATSCPARRGGSSDKARRQ